MASRRRRRRLGVPLVGFVSDVSDVLRFVVGRVAGDCENLLLGPLQGVHAGEF